MQSLLDRFCRYVRIDTTANDATDTYPSSPGQLELGQLLVRELNAMGVPAAAADEHGIVLRSYPRYRQLARSDYCFGGSPGHLPGNHRARG